MSALAADARLSRSARRRVTEACSGTRLVPPARSHTSSSFNAAACRAGSARNRASSSGSCWDTLPACERPAFSDEPHANTASLCCATNM